MARARPAVTRPLSPPWTLNLEIMEAGGPRLTLEERKRTQVCLDFIESLQWDCRLPISPFDENFGVSQNIMSTPSKIRGATLLRLEAVGWSPPLIAQTVLLLHNFRPNNMYHWPKCFRHLAARLEGAAAYAQRAINAYEDECRLRRLPRRCINCEFTHQRCSLRDIPKSKKPCHTCKRHGIKDEQCTQNYNPDPPSDQRPPLEFPPLGFLHHEPELRRRKRTGEALGNSLPLAEDVSRDNRPGDLETRDPKPIAGGTTRGEEHSADSPEETDDFAKRRRISERGEFIYTSPKLNRQTQPNIPEEAEDSSSISRHTTQPETAHPGPELVHTGHTNTEQVDAEHADPEDAGTEHTGYYPDDDLADSSSAEQEFVDSHFRNFSSANLLTPSAPGGYDGSQQLKLDPYDTVNPDGGTAGGDSPIQHEPKPAPRFTAINLDPPSRDSQGAAVGSSLAERPNNGPFSTGAPEIDPFHFSRVDNGAAVKSATTGHDAANSGQDNGQNTRSGDSNDREEFRHVDVEESSDGRFDAMRDDFQRSDNGPVDDGTADNGPVDNGHVDNAPVNKDPADSNPAGNSLIDNGPVDNNAADDADAAMNEQANNQNANSDDFGWFSWNEFMLMNSGAYENMTDHTFEMMLSDYYREWLG